MAGRINNPRNPRFPKLIHWYLLPLCVGCAITVSAQDDAFDHLMGLDMLSSDDNWSRHFRIGGLLGLNIHGKFNENAGVFGISGHNAGQGIYDDGYVREDATGNAGGQTGYWGYDNASQYSSANGGQLTMHSASSYSLNGADNGTASDSFDAGFELAYGDSYWNWEKAKVGWEFGFGILPIHLVDHGVMSVTVNQTDYIFNTGGIVMPNSPYQGGSSGVGEPTISSTPFRTNNLGNTTGLMTGTRILDTMLYTFRLGPWLYWDINDQLGLAVGAGPAVGFAMSTLSYDENISYNGATAVNKGSVSSTSIVYGGYVNATLTYHAPENADLFLGVQYMPLSDASVSGGGRSAQLDLGGQVYISAGVSWPF